MTNKVDVGGTLNRIFSIYGQNAAVLLPVAFGLFVIVGIIGGLLALTFFLLPLVILVGVAASTLYQGMVVKLVEDVQDGVRDHSAGDLISSATPFILPLFVAGLLKGLGVGIGILLIIVPGLILLTIWAVVAPVIVLERTGIIAAFGRSRELVRGNGWPVFGVIVIVFLIQTIVARVLGALGGDSTVLRIILDVIASTITAPIVAITASVLYFALRGDAPVAPAGDVATTPDTSVTAPPPPPPPAQ